MPTRRLIAFVILAVSAVAVLALGLTWKRGGECSARGAVDSAATLVVDGPSIAVAGWAHDPDGIEAVRVMLGDAVLASAKPQLARADVTAALRNCGGDTGKPGFHIEVPATALPAGTHRVDLQAVKRTGAVYPLGSTQVDFSGIVTQIETDGPIAWNARNVLTGWATGRDGDVSVHVTADGREIAKATANGPRDDVGKVFTAWPTAARSGYAIPLSMASLPRGRYRLKVELRAKDGRALALAGPEVHNDMPVGEVLSEHGRYVDPKRVKLDVWAYDEDGIERVEATTESGVTVPARQSVVAEAATLIAFEDAAPDAQLGDYARLAGPIHSIDIDASALPPGVHRLVVRATDKTGRQSILPGPLVVRGGGHERGQVVSCAGAPTRLYLPGFRGVFASGFPQMRSLQAMAGGGCVEVGVRGRLEYLRTTKGRQHDYAFDPDFPPIVPGSGGKTSGESLRELLAVAERLRAPLLITLDGGVWADSRFAVPDYDAVDMLEEDARTAQWNQHDRAEADDALSGLAGSMDNPQLARMMSLNRFNDRFRAYKKRNLQAAVREIVRFARRHPHIDVAVNLDPDQYINPWFFLTQWYDYNPDTLRQFREWLFHLGPYADGGEMAGLRYRRPVTLEEVAALARTRFATIDDVQPPRGAIDYADPWQQIWTQFKRHLVARHYDELATWVAEAGLPPEKIYTSQTFIQADVAVQTDDAATGWTDQAGVSIEGAKPRDGQLGAILYGPSSRNEGKPRAGLSLIDNIARTDGRWGLVEFHPATIELPAMSPSHTDAYRTMLATVNGGARFFSPMWGSIARDQMLKPARFRSYDAFDGTPFEYQLVWWMRLLRESPAGSVRFPFGNEMVDSDDGWRAAETTRLTAHQGALALAGERIEVASPEWFPDRAARSVSVVVAGSWPGRQPTAELELGDGRRLPCVRRASNERRLRCVASGLDGESPIALRLSWSSAEGGKPVELADVALKYQR